MKTAAALASLALVATGAGCIPAQGPMMDPFQDCLGCHDGGRARGWTVAGTWRKGSVVTIVDAAGKTVTLRGNDAGNFYTAEALTHPISVSVDGKAMPTAPSYGGCNACHYMESVTVGPLMAPGAACLSCHGPGGMATAKFSAAGTFPPSGQAVSVGGRTTTTNAVGNFYFYADSAPISFTSRQPASVGGRSMEGGAPSGDCNTCHGGGQGGGD